MDLVFVKDGVRVDGACLLNYNEEMDGYYLGEPVCAPEAVRHALMEAGGIERMSASRDRVRRVYAATRELLEDPASGHRRTMDMALSAALYRSRLDL